MHINYTHRRSDYTQDVYVGDLWIASAKNNHAADLLVTQLDASAEPEPTDEQGPCDDINITEPDRARAAVI